MEKCKGVKFRVAGILLIALIAFSGFILAVNFDNPPTGDEMVAFNKILEPIMRIYNLIKYISSGLAGIVLLFSGIAYMTAGSDPKKREEAKHMTGYVLIGLVIIWAAPVIVNLILR